MATHDPAGSPRDTDRLLLAVAGIVLLGSMLAAIWTDGNHAYEPVQADFRRQVTGLFGPARAADVPRGVQQVLLPALGRVDRCITCHQASAWKGFESARHPYRTHTAWPIRAHPTDRFGCTVCHGGQGWAVRLPDAHGEVPDWDEPLLGPRLAAAYSAAAEMPALVQSNCNLCHRYERETRGADAINLGKALVRKKGCRGCHAVNGRGGAVGPDLTWVGDKSPEQFDYSRLTGRRTVLAWHLAHLKDPRAVVADTLMPNFHLSSAECQSLALLLLSWRKTAFGAAYVPGVPAVDLPSAEERQAEDATKTGPGGWFGRTGCAACHSVAVLGVRSPAPIGPDLSTAVEDTEKRFGVPLERFLANPTGTMAAVLSRQAILTPDERATAARELRRAFLEFRRLVAEGKNPLAVPEAVAGR